jgi:hypothetical protein
VDNQCVTGHGSQPVNKASHAISSKESYLGLQDALWKVWATEGSRMLGAWAGANICVEKDMEVILITSQEKWDRLKTICRKWLKCLDLGATELN